MPARSVFGTAALAASDWLLAAAVASTILVIEELRKLAIRALGARRVAA